MTLSLGLSLLVLGTAVLHAVTQALIKAGSDRLLTRSMVSVVAGLFVLPALPFAGAVGSAALPWLLLSSVTHVLYHFALLRAYHYGDFAQVYPIARGLAPLVVAGLAFAAIGEALTPWQLAGVALVSAGVIGAALSGGVPDGADARAVAYAALTGVIISSYTLFDGIGMRSAEAALAYIVWFFALDGVLMGGCALALRGRRRIATFLAEDWKPGTAGGLMALAIFGTVLWALKFGAIAHVAALRETSVIFAALIGTFFFGEPFGRRRIAAAIAVATGVAFMNAPA